MTLSRRLLLAAGLAPLARPALVRAQSTVAIDFLFPVAVGGPITKLIDNYAQQFQVEHPAITVRPVYAGSYVDTLTKAQTALKAGEAPTMAVLLSTDAYTLIDDDRIVPFDTLPGGGGWLDAFYPAFLRNTRIGGHQWGVPFQRSTIVAYTNQDLFRDAGLDPAQPPATWAENAAMAARLAKPGARAGGSRSRAPASPTGCSRPWWRRPAGSWRTRTAPPPASTRRPAGSALRYWLDLQRSGATPPGLVEWGTTPRDFLEGRSAIVWTTTGNLSNIRTNAKFPFGVAMLPAGERRGSPTGGGNFYLFKAASPEQQAAALTFLQWLTAPGAGRPGGASTPATSRPGPMRGRRRR